METARSYNALNKTFSISASKDVRVLNSKIEKEDPWRREFMSYRNDDHGGR